MSRSVLLGIFIVVNTVAFSQTEQLPVGFTQSELEKIARGDFEIYQPNRGIASPLPFDNLRCMAEWEEIQALTIAWISYPAILKQIVAAAQPQTQVIILSENPQETESYLLSNNAGGAPLDNLDNVIILEGEYDSIWMRDYAGNSVYGNEVDDLLMVDWIYNRPTRPNDDASPQLIAEYLGLDLYTITDAPEDLVNTGGNWMVDGFGQAFASELILEENEVGNPYGVTAKSEEEIDLIISDYLGIDTYIKMPVLPYDEIHHIDMHMKLLDEKTLLVGEYPNGIADGPQINANISYVLSNFTTKWGTPFEVVRIPMPPSTTGLWPSSQPTASNYRTYTNSVFVNNTIILPTYREEYDTTAIRIYEENLPGYTVVPIDCDDAPNAIIALSGAIHCITHSVGVSDPLLISHLPLEDTYNTTNDYAVEAYMNHRDGISNATLFWKTEINGPYNEVAMSASTDNNWVASIPSQAAGTRIYYYVLGEATTGKVQVRPMPAPEGYWYFDVLEEEAASVANLEHVFGKVYPNPASAITCVELNLNAGYKGSLKLVDATGRIVQTIYEGNFPTGMRNYFFDASSFAPGAYFLTMQTTAGTASYPVLIK